MRLAIIGGGMFGACLARQAAIGFGGDEGLFVGPRDRPAPTAESLRNQAWLQSGLHYFQGGAAAAQSFADAGKLLRDRFGLDEPERGVMLIPHEKVETFEGVASELSLKAVRVTAEDAKR